MGALPSPLVAGYTQTTQAQALTMLSERLGDAGNVYWTLPELRLHLAEALRIWQAYTGWYRQRVTLTIAPGNAWYDLSGSVTPASAFQYTVTDQYIVSAILYHLIEAQLSGNSYVGTDQFDLAKIQNAVQNRLNRFLGDSGVVTTRFLQDGGTITAGRALIQPSVVDVRRVKWNSALLWRENEWALNAFLQGWTTPGSTEVYSLSVTPPATLQLAPPPTGGGTLDIVAVQQGPAINIGAGATVLGLPDDFTWGIKWGALADLLSGDGQAKDIARAQYCEQRYQECVELAKVMPSVMQALVNGSQIWIGSVFDLDAFRAGWDNATPGTPDIAGMAGRNLLALSPAPQAGVTVLLDLAGNMTVPASDADFLQVPTDVLDVILDYAQHLASFKMGGDEFAATDQLRVNLAVEAANYNQRLRQLNFYNDIMKGLPLVNAAEVPRIDNPTVTAYQVMQSK